jgi:hypothetical protein
MKKFVVIHESESGSCNYYGGADNFGEAAQLARDAVAATRVTRAFIGEIDKVVALGPVFDDYQGDE